MPNCRYVSSSAQPHAQNMIKRSSAFTLVELLTVIAIIAVLAALTAVVSGSFIKTAQMTGAMQNMRMLGAGFMNYTGQHDGELPQRGSANPSFGGSAAQSGDDWYNAVPKAAGGRALYEFKGANEYYAKGNLLYVPGAKYPTTKNRPLFAIAMNSLLFPNNPTSATARIQNFGAPARTIIFMETGLPDEPTLPGQGGGAYDGGSEGKPSNLVARYKRPTNGDKSLLRESVTVLLMADGHAEALQVKDVLSESGQPYFPQIGQNAVGKVCWTIDPEEHP